MNYIKSIFLVLIIYISACTNDPELNPPFDGNSYLLKDDKDSISFNLEFGKEVLINDKIKIKFNDVLGDSRCPSDLVCIWEGNGEVELEITSEGRVFKETLNTLLDPSDVIIQDISVVLKNLDPYPVSTSVIKKEDYNIDLAIKYANLIQGKDHVQMIDVQDTALIKKDVVNFNSVSLDNDRLKFSLSYSGGCMHHVIELFALKAIEKTNPARVTVRLSHNANNDPCEAYITKDHEFDLAPLKGFMISNYNITDEVILVLLDTEGKPLNQEIRYKF